MNELITAYELKMIEAGCSPGSGRYGVQVDIPDDISAVLPYLNALLDSSRYDHQNRILIWREEDRAYALRRHEIKIVRTSGIDDSAQARELVSAMVERANEVWRNRESITPCLIGKEPPPVIDIFRLLPKTGCAKQCGYPTCLAFAASLREGKTELERCSVLLKPEYSANKLRLAAILSPRSVQY